MEWFDDCYDCDARRIVRHQSTAEEGRGVIEDKGTAYGIKTPKWVEQAIIGGYRDIEKLADYKDKTVFIAQFEAQKFTECPAACGTHAGRY